MKKIYIILLLFIALACEEQDNTYQGPAFVEFAASFRGSSSLYTITNPNQEFNDNLQIQLVAPPQSTPVNVTWEFDEETSTAIEGVHFDFLSDNTVTVEPGSNSTNIEFVVYGDAFTDPEDERTIVLEIVSSDAAISENYNRVVETLSITCPSDLEGTYDYESTAEPGSPTFWNGTGEVTLTEIESGVYALSDFANGAFGDPQSVNIIDVCNEITEYGDNTLVKIISAGVDPETQVVTINFELTCCAGNNGDRWTYVMTPQ